MTLNKMDVAKMVVTVELVHFLQEWGAKRIEWKTFVSHLNNKYPEPQVARLTAALERVSKRLISWSDQGDNPVLEIADQDLLQKIASNF